MTKYILASAAALALIVTPAMVVAQDADKAGETGKMKGPPNADGYKKSDKDAGGSKDNNGAGAATSTGEDKK